MHISAFGGDIIQSVKSQIPGDPGQEMLQHSGNFRCLLGGALTGSRQNGQTEDHKKKKTPVHQSRPPLVLRTWVPSRFTAAARASPSPLAALSRR